jgi:hypothetical protein
MQIKENATQYVTGLLMNLISGIIVFYWAEWVQQTSERTIITVLFFIMTTIITLIGMYFYYNRDFLEMTHKYGIDKILPSQTIGAGSTIQILKTIIPGTGSYCFMGIAFNKWIERDVLDELDKIIRMITHAREGNFRVLLLNPESKYAIDLARRQNKPDDAVKKQILRGIGVLKDFHQRDFNVDCRLYDFLPIFRIAIINERYAYWGFYRLNEKGESESPQVVFDRYHDISFYQAFHDYFEFTWKSNSIPVDWSKKMEN